MKQVMRWRRVLAAVSPFLALVGCRAIAGYRDLGYAPASTVCGSVSLPSTGNGSIRLVNAGTQGTEVDFCIRASGTADWGKSVFAETGPGCHSGLAYAQVTIPFAVPSGKIDVEAIAAGSTCAAAPLSQLTGLAVGDSTSGAPVVTVVRMGGGGNAERIVGLPEEVASTAQAEERLRMVNALSGGGAINFGLTSATSLPATVATSLPQPIAVGGVEPAGPTSIGTADTSGYLGFEALGADLGAVLETQVVGGQASALFVIATPHTQDTQTIFAIGDPSDNAHAVRGLYCEDVTPVAAPTGDAGPEGAAARDSGSVPAESQLLASCTLTPLPAIAVDTINVALYGADGPYENDRRQPLYDAIAARLQTDLMCVVEIDRQSDKVAVAAAAAKTRFPFSYFPDPQDDLDTQAADATEADGGVPAPSGPPCGNGVSVDDVNNVYACVASNCSTTQDMSGTIGNAVGCLSQQCLLPLASLYHHGAQQNACFACIIAYLTSDETLAYGQTACLTDARQPFAFEGQTTTMILSHYPLANQQTFVLPSTGWRRSVLYSQVQLEDQSVDFYCAALSSPNNDTQLPYTGNYGRDLTTTLPDGGLQVENGWEDEEDLQVARAIAFVTQNSGKTGRPAIIAGDWEATLGVTGDGGVPILGSVSPEVMLALGNAFTAAEPPGYAPACETCPSPQNLYNGAISPEDNTRMFLYGFAPSSTLDDTFWGTANTVPLVGGPYEPPPAGGVGPISNEYPRLVHVIRPRPK